MEKITTKIRTEDLFRFQMYHTYAGVSGRLFIFLGILAIGDLIVNFNTMAVWTRIFCVFIILWIAVLNPVNLYFRSKKQQETTELFQNPIDVEISSEGLGLFQGENGGVVEWKDISKIVILNKLVIFYMGKVRAHLLPLDENPEQAEQIVEVIKASAKGTKIVGGKKRRKQGRV